MELRALRYFLAVAREQSITGAAEQMNLTQPNFSRQLKELEDELGVTLFQRGRRGRQIVLTEEGRIFRQRAEEAIELLEKARTEVKSFVENVNGDVYVGCAETDAMRSIFRVMKSIQREYPDIRFHIVSGHQEVVAERLERGLLDFGIFVEPTDLEKYDSLRLPQEDTWGILLRRSDPLAEKDTIRPEDLAGLPLISSNQALFQEQLMSWSGDYQSQMHVTATYNLLFNASLMVEEGMGYAVCLDKIIPVTEGRPLCFRPLEPRMKTGLYAAWKKHQVFSRPAQLFLRRLQWFLTENAIPKAHGKGSDLGI